VDAARPAGATALQTMLTIVSTDPAGIEPAFRAFSAQADVAATWLAGHPPAPCYASEHAAWSGVVAAMVAARDSLLSGVDLEATIQAYVDAAAAFDPGLSACQTLKGPAAP